MYKLNLYMFEHGLENLIDCLEGSTAIHLHESLCFVHGSLFIVLNMLCSFFRVSHLVLPTMFLPRRQKT